MRAPQALCKRNNFSGGDGILVDSVEDTIDNVGCIAHDSMRETDETIIKLMIKS